MKRKPNKPQQEPRERPGSWEEPADPGGASSGGAGGGSPGGAGTEGTSILYDSRVPFRIDILMIDTGFVIKVIKGSPQILVTGVLIFR